MHKKNSILTIVFVVLLCLFGGPLHAVESLDTLKQMNARIQELMEEGDIPGLTLVWVKGKQLSIKSYGYAEKDENELVTPKTLFELASCSKSFTALAMLHLAKQYNIDLNDPVSAYLPYFYATYKGEKYDITLAQLLHHTSGIRWNTISDIPESNDKEALGSIARVLSGTELRALPGKEHHYATVNYDILGAIIEKVSGISFENYMQRYVFDTLKLHYTSVGLAMDTSLLAEGYKISFFLPYEYAPPPYRGNFPAGYVISNGQDMARWLQIQMGLIKTDLESLINVTQQRDERVPPDKEFLSSYAMGWEVSLRGDGIIGHDGLNPTFSSSVRFNKIDTVGVVVLANSNSNYTYFIADYVMNQLLADGDFRDVEPENQDDRLFSGLSIMLALYSLLVLGYCGVVLVQAFSRKRAFQLPSRPILFRLVVALLLFIPFLGGIYLIPEVVSGVSWRTAVVWSPVSFPVAVGAFFVSLILSYIAYLLSLLFPLEQNHKNSIPLLVLLSLVSGIANVAVIYIIIYALNAQTPTYLLLFYLGLALFTYVAGRKIIETRLIRITLDIIYEIRVDLIRKVFSVPFQTFEKIDRGDMYATLNDDTNQIGTSARIIVEIITSLVTITFAFIYLGFISFWATLLTIATIILLAFLYHMVSMKSERFFEETRDTRNVFMSLLNGLLDGFKELSLHQNKREVYQQDIENATDKFRRKLGTARIKFVDAFLIGESIIIIVLSVIAFVFPSAFPYLPNYKLVSFIMVLLYLIGPITSVLNAVPSLMELKVSWNRVQKFIKTIQRINVTKKVKQPSLVRTPIVEQLKSDSVVFEYEKENSKFVVGPLSFEVNRGEILFVVGGNGSGKTTLAKLLTGLYSPIEGCIKINGVPVDSTVLGEYFSVVFSDFHLFEKLYNSSDYKNKEKELQHYLTLLGLENKVQVSGNAFSTIKLSQGQKKRLALFQCYIENKPIYLFDELAADQDPEFRKFFYKELLLNMKCQGKIVVAITHDDQYFDVADKIMVMEYGKIRSLESKVQAKVSTN